MMFEPEPMSNRVNYFAHRSVAERYAAGRPNVHPAIVQRIAQLAGKDRFRSALDVGCGTGQSTRALAEISDRVVGIDSSGEMLAQVTPSPGTHYQLASAESLPFSDSSFELVTVGLAFHWFDQERFLREARRVLHDDGYLVIYNSGVLGELEGESAFATWYQGVYLPRYPTPPRSQTSVSGDFVAPFGFLNAATSELVQPVEMSQDQFLGYLLTQSNIIAAVELGTESLETVAAMLREATAPFFRNERRTLPFHADIALIRPH